MKTYVPFVIENKSFAFTIAGVSVAQNVFLFLFEHHYIIINNSIALIPAFYFCFEFVFVTDRFHPPKELIDTTPLNFHFRKNQTCLNWPDCTSSPSALEVDLTVICVRTSNNNKPFLRDHKILQCCENNQVIKKLGKKLKKQIDNRLFSRSIYKVYALHIINLVISKLLLDFRGSNN